MKYDSLTNENCRKSSELRPPLLIVRQLRGFIPAIGRNFSVQSYRTDFIPQQDGFLPLSALRLSSTLAENSAVSLPPIPVAWWCLVIQVIRCIRSERKIYGCAVKFHYKEYSSRITDSSFFKSRIGKLLFWALFLLNKRKCSEVNDDYFDQQEITVQEVLPFYKTIINPLKLLYERSLYTNNISGCLEIPFHHAPLLRLLKIIF